jgi:hypothetical protein
VKIEQVLVHYLIKNKSLPLQGIGTFKLEASIPDSADTNKPVFIPENAITFDYNPRQTEDEGLVDFIVEHTNKIKPLAASDLDSFLSLARQFLNIGKPFILPNIGTLEKLNSGVLAFKQGLLIAEKMEPNKVRNQDDGEVHEESLFNDYQKERKNNNGGKTILILLVLIIIGCLVWGVWHYAFNKKEPIETLNSTEGIVPLKDSAFKADSTTIAGAKLKPQEVSDTVSFKIVIREYHTQNAAEKRLEKLKAFQRNVVLYTDDSITYKIAESFNLPLSDTTRILDSLKRYYAKARLEIK